MAFRVRGVHERPQRRRGGARRNERRDPGDGRQPELLSRRHPGGEQQRAGAQLSGLYVQAVHVSDGVPSGMGPGLASHRFTHHVPGSGRPRVPSREPAAQLLRHDYPASSAGRLAQRAGVQDRPLGRRRQHRRHGPPPWNHDVERAVWPFVDARLRRRHAARHGVRVQRIRQQRRHEGAAPNQPHGSAGAAARSHRGAARRGSAGEDAAGQYAAGSRSAGGRRAVRVSHHRHPEG